ncbi:UNVERIFIED_CONTAM: Metallothionein-like protein type 3 [Sesamum latifolium]|uniref:Metallothionein-like protein type 3 n=1 Tax=Sesamum latifolium TaxID=2727402 RepID=A0AAW2TPJ4_9LAMI
MSDKCGNCDCADKTQCVKNGYAAADIMEAEEIISYTETVVVDVTAAAAEHDGKCKCGSSCACTDCTCGL